MKQRDSFDRIAFVYDTLARLVFGDSLFKSQTCFLTLIPAGSRVLIMGGGTGWLLTELFRQQPLCNICYVDTSKKMISKARIRVQSDKRVEFVHGNEGDIPHKKFDIIITAYFLDLFDNIQLQPVVTKILSHAEPQGLWMVADFNDQRKWWQRCLLWMMYLFFRLVGALSTVSLPQWQRALAIPAIESVSRKFFYGGFIESAVYRIKG